MTEFSVDLTNMNLYAGINELVAALKSKLASVTKIKIVHRVRTREAFSVQEKKKFSISFPHS